MSNIKEILMNRDKMTSDEADEILKEAHQQFDMYLLEGDMESAENICSEFFGLEPDYLFGEFM